MQNTLHILFFLRLFCSVQVASLQPSHLFCENTLSLRQSLIRSSPIKFQLTFVNAPVFLPNCYITWPMFSTDVGTRLCLCPSRISSSCVSTKPYIILIYRSPIPPPEYFSRKWQVEEGTLLQVLFNLPLSTSTNTSLLPPTEVCSATVKHGMISRRAFYFTLWLTYVCTHCLSYWSSGGRVEIIHVLYKG